MSETQTDALSLLIDRAFSKVGRCNVPAQEIEGWIAKHGSETVTYAVLLGADRCDPDSADMRVIVETWLDGVNSLHARRHYERNKKRQQRAEAAE